MQRVSALSFDLPKVFTLLSAMKFFTRLCFLVAFSCIARSRVLEKCEMASILVNNHNISEEDIPKMVCIAEHESDFNTAALNDLNHDGSRDYGLFHINDRYWCGNDSGKNVCNISCDDLLDEDLTDDLMCVEEIIKDTKGWLNPDDGYVAWAAYENRCKTQNLTEYILECTTWIPSSTPMSTENMTKTISSTITTVASAESLTSVVVPEVATDFTTLQSTPASIQTSSFMIQTTDSVNQQGTFGSVDDSEVVPLPVESDTAFIPLAGSGITWENKEFISPKYLKLMQMWLNEKLKDHNNFWINN